LPGGRTENQAPASLRAPMPHGSRSTFERVSGQPRVLTDQRAAGEQAASLAASWCRRRLGRAHAQTTWQMLADAAQLGVIRHGRPEAWAAGAVIALARVSGLIGSGRPLSAQQVADEFGVSLRALAVTGRELARPLNLATRGAHPPGLRPHVCRSAYARHTLAV
jgi:hypothetical protein